jgi:hypothetical protein
MHLAPPLATSGYSALLGAVVLDAFAAMIMLSAVAGLLRSPKHWFRLGLVSKVAWAVVTLAWTWNFGDVVVPVGAALVLWHVRSLGRRHAAEEPPDLPFATGSRVGREEER